MVKYLILSKKSLLISSFVTDAVGPTRVIIWTSAGILSIGPLGTNFSSEILIDIYIFSFKKMHLKISSGKWRPYLLGLNVFMNATRKQLQRNNTKTLYMYNAFGERLYVHRIRAWLHSLLGTRIHHPFVTIFTPRVCSRIPKVPHIHTAKIVWHIDASESTINSNGVCIRGGNGSSI